MRHTTCAAHSCRLTAADVARREAAFFDAGRVVNRAVLNVAIRLMGWNRSRLAREMRMDRAHVGRVINGEVHPSPEFRYRMTQVLPCVAPDELFVVPGGGDIAPAEDLDDEHDCEPGDVAPAGGAAA